jgi:hypothetical protein
MQAIPFLLAQVYQEGHSAISERGFQLAVGQAVDLNQD